MPRGQRLWSGFSCGNELVLFTSMSITHATMPFSAPQVLRSSFFKLLALPPPKLPALPGYDLWPVAATVLGLLVEMEEPGTAVMPRALASRVLVLDSRWCVLKGTTMYIYRDEATKT